MANSKKIAALGAYDNAAALKSFTDATQNSLNTLTGAIAIGKIHELYDKLDKSTISEDNKARIKNDIGIFHDLLFLYADTVNDNHDYKTKYPMSVTPGYQEILTDFGTGQWEFPKSGQIYLNLLSTGGLFSDTTVNKVFTKENCLPITNFPSSNSDPSKPSIAFMDNFDTIYTAIDGTIT